MDQEIRNKIAQDFGLGSMDSGEQERMIEKIGTLLFESVIERAVDSMDDKTMDDFGLIIDSAGKDYEKVITFLKTRVGGFDSIVVDEMSRLKRATSGIFA